ncbi:hypothetical protein [Sandaracinus amylolyticus]|uniref:hypothetical protein n=1 Tax=Sandaracinus amylolyticus TaxID=927083 RepID=UPI001F365451|nr:hypothetical protein [Sandaracinus amylolyticus]UJR84185.1 Hypothetical protein I5071_62560 [Sandaracinus amylolyticus]
MTHPLVHLDSNDVVLDDLPDDVRADFASRAKWMQSLTPDSGGLESLVADLQGWQPGQTVRVAFLGGSLDLHEKIELVTRDITSACNIDLDFGRDPATGRYRRWSESDIDHAADIRVSFDQGGYWSLVGTDSVDTRIGRAGGPVGGGPGQRSLNLGGFAEGLPPGWRGTVLHEFLHALAFHHEHQNPEGPCQAEFRWEDDPGYAEKKDARGAYVTDDAGRRPGIYRYLSGYPNRWSQAKVDHNLRAPSNASELTGSRFDPESVMLYRFASLFYKTHPSPCAPAGDGQHLSRGDVEALQRLYPYEATNGLQVLTTRRAKLAERLELDARASSGLEGSHNHPAHALERIRARDAR